MAGKAGSVAQQAVVVISTLLKLVTCPGDLLMHLRLQGGGHRQKDRMCKEVEHWKLDASWCKLHKSVRLQTAVMLRRSLRPWSSCRTTLGRAQDV